MRFNRFIPAVVALGASLASAQRDECEDDITITEPNQAIRCETIEGDLIVDRRVAGELIINGPETIRGSVRINGAGALVSVSSPTITRITGTLNITDCNVLSNVQLTALRSVDRINLQRLGQLSNPVFGDDESFSANNVLIADTFISDLSGLRLTTVETLNINNNIPLERFESQLTSINGSLIISNNGDNMTVTLEDLETAEQIEISNVASFSVPSLTEVATLKFDNNPQLETFRAANLTSISQSLSFINNREITNISLPVLTDISAGDMTIQNNSNLEILNGFPELERVFGAIILRGVFEEVELPSLRQVRGTVNVTSTTDIAEFCDFFQDAKDNNRIEGEMSCTSNNDLAEEDEGDNGEELRGDGSGGDGDNEEDDPNAAGIVNVNSAVLSLALLAGIAQLL